jgi:hypothetical protein
MGASLTRWAKAVSLRGMKKACPEDVVLAKLLWRKPSGSMKQWTDVLGILKVQGEQLNFDYLWQWAEILNVTNDLDQAFTEAGLYGF